MSKTSLAVGTLTFLLAAHAALGADGVLGAAPPPPPDLRPLLEIRTHRFSTDSSEFADQEISIYQGGAVQLKSTNSPGTSCVNTVLALGTGAPAAFRNLQQALRTGQVGNQRDCGQGFEFGLNLEYSLEWRSTTGRVNSFEFGTLYPSGCPAGVGIIKNAVDAYVAAFLDAPGTKVVRSAVCPQ
jgi:hypothetical protein